MRKAHLVIFIDTETRRVTGAGVFSEPCPTSHMLKSFPVHVMEVAGKSYSEACKLLKQDLAAHPALRWLDKLLKES